MAESLKITGIINDTGISLTRSVSNLSVTTAGDGWNYIKQLAATGAGTAFSTNTVVSAPGWCLIVNKDATNFVTCKVGDAGATNDTAFSKLKAGEFALFPVGAAVENITVVADTASCLVEFYLREA